MGDDGDIGKLPEGVRKPGSAAVRPRHCSSMAASSLSSLRLWRNLQLLPGVSLEGPEDEPITGAEEAGEDKG
ncbi:uncharacterized protein A4U43_C10F13790 [Asparagus officinalis]|uniref:Uncharacterized protein n=1 Tax=Asparagus officinalis TaxID=4686 RepID=A0A5P1E2L5_ASPOF|nr:uncharacterized protein A4U43_C10F13790 [Asparagus officinalis]